MWAYRSNREIKRIRATKAIKFACRQCPMELLQAMDGRLPLPSLLSHALVAFTIEFDNEFEHQAPHRTTNHSLTAGTRHVPWLVSMVMWSNFMRFVGQEGTTIQ